MNVPTSLKAIAFFAVAMPACAQTPPSFEGNFKGISPDADQQMVISRDGDTYSVRIRVKQGKCVGAVEASGIPKDHHILTARSGACSLSMFRAGPNVQVEEDGCDGLRGPECSFTNVYSPR